MTGLASPVVDTCRNCDSPLSPNPRFCPNCGQKATAERLTLHEMSHELLHALVHVDRSALSLVRLLVIQPGVVARDFVLGKRRRYFGPFAFLVVVVALASSAIAISGFHAVTSDVPNTAADLLQHHVNLILFAQVPILAGACRILDRSQQFNYAEYLVLASYTKGMQILFYAVVVVPVWYALAAHPLVTQRLYYLYLTLGTLYFGFALSQFLPGRRIVSAVKGVTAALATQVATLGTVSLVANLIDFALRHG